MAFLLSAGMATAATQTTKTPLTIALEVPVAHKTGDSGNIANDVGIIYARSGPIVIAFLANGITGSYAKAEDRIGRIAKLVVDHFDGPASLIQ